MTERRHNTQKAGTTMTRQVKTQYANVHRALLTDEWTANVHTLEDGIRDFGPPPGVATDYQVSMFEMPGDPHLHVNVTLAHETKPVKGWAGPGVTAAGFIYNRRFASGSIDRILSEIRRMVFAPRA
jgi:hypothetical protein